jgi:hypothetical protein
MISIIATADWKNVHRGGTIGLLEVSGVDNKISSEQLNLRKRETEGRLRTKYILNAV